MSERPSLAIVIPTLNEAEYLPDLLRDLAAIRIPTEILVVDGGSLDDTVERARTAGIRVLSSPPGRARQLRAGAAGTEAPWLFFLHADCRVHTQALRALEDFVSADARDRHGHFAFALHGRGPYWRFIELGVRLRERLSSLVYGDQGLVVSRQAYTTSGGHPDWPIMEDVGVLDRLRGISEETRLSATLLTSPRRYETEGRVRTWLSHAALMALFRLGASPQRLSRLRGRGAALPRRSLIVFAKAPRPGAVKTRLAADVGDTEAARIYRTMGRGIVDAVRGGPYGIDVHYDPPEAAADVVSWLGAAGLSYHAQAPGDLGHRMEKAFASAFEHADEVCIIGTDAPSVSASTVRGAFRALEHHDLVVGPSVDGGYYLLALKRPCPELFSDIAWSTAEVLGATLHRARQAGLTVRLLKAETDVDTLSDVPPHFLLS